MVYEKLFYVVLAIIAGVVVSFQGPISAALGINLKGSGMVERPDLATFWSFLAGAIIILIYLIVFRKPLPEVSALKATPWWTYLGPVTGVIYVAVIVIIYPKLGVGTATVLLIFAQVITAMLLDTFGVFYPAKPMTLIKAIGVVLMIGGVYLINK